MHQVPPDLDPAYFIQALEENAMAVEIVRSDGTFVWVNPAFERISGYTLAEAQGRTAEELLRSNVHPPEFYAHAMATLRAGKRWHGVITSRRKDGSLFDSDTVVVHAIRTTPGEPHLLALRRDVTEERRILRALRESEERYRIAAEAARDGLWDWDLADGRFHGSRRWFELHGAEPADVDLEWSIARIHEEDRESFRAGLDLHLAGESPTFEAEYRLPQPGADPRWVLCRGLAVRDPQGRAHRIAGSLTDISDRKRSEEQLFRAATCDALTGVPNRAYFVRQVELAILRAGRQTGPTFALLFIDLRRFKQVNDGYGHAVGDALLCAVARRIESALRGGDTLARLGGDEFAVLIDGVSDQRAAGFAAARLGRALSRPFEIDGRTLDVAATIGVALGDGTAKVDELVRAADEAMYLARSDGDRGHHVAGPDAGARSERRARMAADLREALFAGQLQVYYQPIIDITNGRTIGAEALSRWTHPELGPVSPAEFVAIAEETGLGPRFGRHVVDTVTTQLRAWETLNAIPPSFFVNVNVSARQLLDRTLVEQVRRLHEDGGLRRGRLGLEITETVLIERPEQVVETMGQLRRIGVHFSLDDFGTGFSSLSHMRTFPVQSIKVDRSFVERVVEDSVTAQIVSGLVQMASALGLMVVAEGVETLAQERVLSRLGFGVAQGYLYGRPATASAFTDAIAQQSLLGTADAGVSEP